MVNKKDVSTEERILEAAKNVFIKKGMAGARMQDIADEAGINKALVHYYFRNKEQLFENIFARLTADFWPKLTSVFESDTPLFKKIETFCAIYIDKITDSPYILLFVLYEMNQRPKQFAKKMFGKHTPRPAKLLAQIDEQVKADKIRPIAPAQLIMNMISLAIFPFIGKPMFMAVMNMDEQAFNNLIKERKKEVPRFIIESIKK